LNAFSSTRFKRFCAELRTFKPVFLIGVRDKIVPTPLTIIFAMDFSHYKNAFIQEALKNGYSEQNIQRCLEYAELLFSNEVPVIYNTSHLSNLVGYNKTYLKKASHYLQYFYRDFEITKKNGTKRPISEPLPSLKEIQIWILKNILYKPVGCN
jgi:RNA-directed DNA polymerase